MEGGLTVDEVVDSALRYKVVIVDFDGVLACVNVNWQGVRDAVSRAIGRRVNSLLEYFRESFGSAEFEFVNGIVKCFEEDALKGAEPTEFAVKLLSKALRLGVKVYVATMQCGDTVREFLSRAGLIKAVKNVLGRDQYPSKLEMIKAIKEFEGINEGDAVLVDDSIRNLRIAESLGVKGLHYRAPECVRTH